MHKIELVLPKAHQDIPITPDVKRELTDVQRELNDKSDRFADGKVHFIISKGFYKHEKKLLRVASVIVNKTNKDIQGLKMNLAFKLKNHPSATFPTMKGFLDKDFLGLIKHNQAFILHLEVPSEDLGNEDLVFQPHEIAGKVENLEYQFLK
ncbi:hypothetical protein HXA31_00400 [Salipaludibacillus agaradhaerens]|uniref:Uncharacterized protein n=1 Tax=Salipaludibacillus agaradhaerens TaxID=76935 RepID=A0A9Q4B3I0_SALAG|nr:hypothetical protein [Salipaludibacillus agaradhaerens]MCR6097693.1 hypothetical protein [Salipaludibacillus agaradhaerens]MCR6112823.1 hypothetical protein [Salipaludibacillus agaradhaerens]